METDGFRDLMRQAQAGNRPALDRLFALALPFVERVVFHAALPVRPGESLHELCQNVSQRILEKLGQFRGAHEAADDAAAWALFCGWIRQVVHSVRINQGRVRQRPDGKQVPLKGPGDGSTNQGGAVDPTASEPTPSANVRADEQTRLILEALNKLPDPINREIIRLRFFEGRSLRQVAEQLQMTYDVVRERFKMTKKRLQRELEGLQ